MIKLRGHHLICLHFFNGEGYDAGFIENLGNLLKRAQDEDIVICGETDDICEKCPYRKEQKCAYSEDADEAVKEMDEMALTLLGTGKGLTVGWAEVKGKIPGIFHRWLKSQCPECEWKQVCEKNGSYNGLKSQIYRR